MRDQFDSIYMIYPKWSKSKSTTSLILIIASMLLVLGNSFYAIQNQHNKFPDESFAKAMSFHSGWNMTVNSISNSNPEAELDQNDLNLDYSYQNPYLNYQNLSKVYQDDPEYTISLVGRIQKYLDQNRSRDNFDTGKELPVNAEIYLEIAIKYRVPIDQMLAVARSESRFGSDCFTASGNPNRICRYKNIFSIGLTETSSLGFNSWEDGVEAFGKLYQSRKNRGFDDCKIWKIYNPNGDYCGKILGLSKQINTFLTEA